ncbi:TetR/AcrR family transcriptional regulator [Demequina rhizosphaerae]|uniref:TetR/AcrR family transcriptional regulator n=1 Tax=Demequina rhizosphaerae TaxID=1638985 RepID=UPI0007863B57|nr:TetR/AcrR family transcriptional regulator [Demequina rhizosphaerae]
MVSTDDLTARAKIRDCALALFGERGPDSVTVRDIAACAGVSPALVLHHYGSKDGLREAVDAHVAGIFDGLFDQSAENLDAIASGGERAAASFAEVLLGGLPAGSAIPAYLRRLLLTGDPVGQRLFREWFEMTRETMRALESAGGVRPTADPDARAAFLLVNDLAMVLLRDHLADVLGVDPLAPDGLARWAAGTIDAYSTGVLTPASQEEPS